MTNQTDSSIIQTFRVVTEMLKGRNCTYALAGGLLVSAYREDVRATNDIDLLLFTEEKPELVAQEILSSLGRTVTLVKLHELKPMPLMNKKGKPAVLAVGREPGLGIGIDFILPAMPWFDTAIKRAQFNQIDFGFGPVPCITVEDMILAKLFAARDKDFDDIKSILRMSAQPKAPALDGLYLGTQIRALAIHVPTVISKMMPKPLRALVRKRLVDS